MNFDLGIARSFLTGVFLTNSAVAVASAPQIDVSLAAQVAPAAGEWSNLYAAALTAQLPNSTDIRGYRNYQRDAMREFLSIYSITRNNGTEANGWDDLVAQVASGGTAAQKEKIRTALFGDGTATGSIVSGAHVGGDPDKVIYDAYNRYGRSVTDKQAALLRMGEVMKALGVPRTSSQIPNANTTYNVDAHFNHFHVYVKPPERVDIETTNNLLAATEELPIILAAASSPTATDAGSASALTTAATQQVKYDAVYSSAAPCTAPIRCPITLRGII